MDKKIEIGSEFYKIMLKIHRIALLLTVCDRVLA